MERTAPDRTFRILAYDSGAIRTGWAVLDQGENPIYVDSGVIHTSRPKDELFQHYRMRLTKEWVKHACDHLNKYNPDIVICETVPSRGAGIPEQLYLANVQITIVHAICILRDIEVQQISARTVQKHIAIKGKSKGVTKPQVRNGVLARLPELTDQAKKWGKIWEESDALAIALFASDNLL